ncbi:replication restart DNA helicase PriA [Trichococcus patagoniensis]|uniref:Replication restart protein PriA n=1 Tax=Trichococcus patagoniensis TaxID=382641 RepID=A0A2T5IRH1_9LACT|nr:primosomal protein N' [Trichococcus patagoniensis]PTQ86418.1 replication restart DNA helicase PriA [Trichococcus patagoniensis]
MQIAKVIVDIPAMQTNRPFDYAIPPAMEHKLGKGMRVEVPFNKRIIQGFITEISDHTDFEGELKEIIQPLDIEPALTEELLLLGEEMAETVYAYRIHCYQTMLPPLMKAKYEKEIEIVDELDEGTFYGLFQGKSKMSWENAVDRGILPQLIELKRAGKIEVNYILKNQAKAKTVQVYYSDLEMDSLEDAYRSLKKSAKQQQALLAAIMSMNGTPLTSKEYKDQFDIGSSAIRTGVEKGWLKAADREILRDPFKDRLFQKTEALPLSDEQTAAFQTMGASIREERHEIFLLQGVTGSGKTEVYLQLIAEVIKQGKTALMLVPEIALTPQMVNHFKSRFGNRVAVMHSALSAGEKYDEWRKIHRGDADVVVGARSSIFAPVENLGIIIMDEEHESTYKQDENPKYHARNIAIWRGQHNHCPVVLGSATPSLESRARAQKKVYTLVELKGRFNQRALPQVEIVDMRDEFKANNRSSFSMVLQEKITDRLQKKQQIVLMLNKRGYSSFIMCRDCGFVLECPNCDISLTLHMDSKTMKCHYCGHEEEIPNTCPKCKGHNFRYYGTGTQKIEEELQMLFPDARILRMDVDTTRKKGGHEAILSAFGRGEADILLGTQMIAKGLDFPNITLVGVINADTSLGLPDFRSSERTFQLLTQVSGRAGRAELSGEVVVQSYNPDHYAILFAQQHNYEGFYRTEMSLRHKAGYPPYFYTALITVSNPDEKKAQKKIYEIHEILQKKLEPDTIMLGPSKGSIARVNNRYYFQILVKYKQETKLHPALKQILDESQKENARGLYISIDSEPVNFF